MLPHSELGFEASELLYRLNPCLPLTKYVAESEAHLSRDCIGVYCSFCKFLHIFESQYLSCQIVLQR